MVRPNTPLIMAHNIFLPEIRYEGTQPYVLAYTFPNGAVVVAAEGWMNPVDDWTEPKADVLFKEADW